MKGEVISVIDKAKEAETNLTDQHKIIAEKEREINEFRPGYELEFSSFVNSYWGLGPCKNRYADFSQNPHLASLGHSEQSSEEFEGWIFGEFFYRFSKLFDILESPKEVWYKIRGKSKLQYWR